MGHRRKRKRKPELEPLTAAEAAEALDRAADRLAAFWDSIDGLDHPGHVMRICQQRMEDAQHALDAAEKAAARGAAEHDKRAFREAVAGRRRQLAHYRRLMEQIPAGARNEGRPRG